MAGAPKITTTTAGAQDGVALMRKKTVRVRRAGVLGASRMPELIGFVLAAALFLALATDLRPGRAQSTNSTFTVSTTTGSGSALGTNQALSFLSTPGLAVQIQKLANGAAFTGTAAGTTVTATAQLFVTIGPGGPLPTGTDIAVCNGAPSGTVWPAPNCTYNSAATLFTVLAGTTNFHANVHTQANTVLGAESPAFGLVFGDFHPAFQTALLDQSWSFVDALMAQLRGFGVNGAGPGATLPLGGQLASAIGDEFAGGVNIAQAGPDGRMRPSPWFVWVRPHGMLGRVDSSPERLGFRYDIAGVSAGAEYRWPGPWRAGGTLGYAHSSITQASTGDKGGIDSLQIGAYGGYRDARTHVVVAALFQQNWISSERLTVLSPAVATASYSAQSYSVGVEAGRKYPVLQAWVQPLASLVFTHLRQGGFTESGTTLLEIAGESRAVNALKLSLGVRAWRDFDLGWGVVTPELRARWVQDILNERRAISGRFVGDPAQTAFTVNGAKPAPAAAVLGAGVTLGAGPGFKLSFGYDAELRANATSHTIHARLKLVW